MKRITYLSNTATVAKSAPALFIVATLLVVAVQGWAKDNPPPKLIVDDSPLKAQVRAETSFAPIVKKVEPSVVNIYSTTVVHEHMNPFFSDPFLRHFFGDEQPQSGQAHTRREESLGSGVIVSPDGYILTANHVVQGADSVKVALSTGEKEFDAKVIGTDPPTDVAVLKIDVHKPLPAITIGDSDKIEVGDWVLAVGNPFGVGQTVTAGIVSALGRGGMGLNGATSYEDFIQTDAAINPGNSGGALTDAEGRLIGINTAIMTRSGGYQGVGFAVPIDMARTVLESLIQYGKVTRGFLGVHMQPLTPDLAKEFGLPDDASGVLVAEVDPHSAAARAGIKDGDVVVAINDKKVTDPRTLQLLVTKTPPHTKVEVKVLRGEPGARLVEKTLTATLGELPQEAMGGGGESETHGRQSKSNMDSLDGVEVADVNAQFRSQFDIPSNIHGALVTSVDPDSNSAQAGLHQGDVILEIDRHPVHNADEAVKLSEETKGDIVLLRVWTPGENGGPSGTRYLTVDNIKHK